MIAMDKVLERGFTWWDRALFPRDEFEMRTRVVQQAMAEAGLDVLTVWSSYYHTEGSTGFLAGWPMGGAVLLFRDGEPILFSPGGSREHYFAAMQVWCEMRTAPGGIVAAVAKAVADKGLAAGRLGLVRPDQIDVGPWQALQDAFAAFEIIDFTGAYEALRASKRPRERVAIGASQAIACQAVAAGQQAFAEGASNAAALAEAEGVARLLGARDFRGLVNSAPNALRPYEGTNPARHAPLVLWVAVDQHGYWATASTMAAIESSASHALAAMIAAVRPGVRAGDVADQALAHLPEAARAMALSYGLGGGIGLGLEETPLIAPGEETVLRQDMVLSLQVFAQDDPTGDPLGFASAMMRVGPQGAEPLASAS
ncbi:MAG TPA: M24 family metallopeptidase [Caulobacteraceae bacterium]|jgi:Xaa-Pro aminopeptidase/Xaa-Pro dipeptidase